MNWVGGVRRRVLQREEVRRRQDIFFAAHTTTSTTSAKRTNYEGPNRSNMSQHAGGLLAGPANNRRRISPQKWRSEGMAYERLKRGTAWDSYTSFIHKHERPGWESGGSQSARPHEPRKENKVPARRSKACVVRPASIHGPFSRYLLRFELQAIGMELEEGTTSLEERQKQGCSRTSEQERKAGRECLEKEDRITRERTHNKNKEARGTISTSQKHEESKSNQREHHEVASREKHKSKSLGLCCTEKAGSRNSTKQATSSEISSRQSRQCDAGGQSQFRNELRSKRGSQDDSEQNKGKWNKSVKKACCNSIRNRGMHGSDNYRESEGVVSKRRKIRENFCENLNSRACVLDVTDSGYHVPDSQPQTSIISSEKRNNSCSKPPKRTDKKWGHKKNKRDGELQTVTQDTKQSKNKRKTCDMSYGSDLLAGAPRLRQVLSLSPEHRGGKIWAPLHLSPEPPIRNRKKCKDTVESSYQNTPDCIKNNWQGNEGEECFKMNMELGTQKKQRSTQLQKNSVSKFQNEWEAERLSMLLGSRFHGSSGVGDSFFTLQDSTGPPKTDVGKFTQPQEKADTNLGDHGLMQRSMEVATTGDLASGHTVSRINSPMTDAKSHVLLNVIPSTGEKTLDAAQRKVPENEMKNQCFTNQKPKLSAFTRKIFKVESGLSFARERKDKTPYLDRSFGTPWLVDDLVNTPGSSLPSSRTPTDPTLERSWEDSFGNQGGSEPPTTNSMYTAAPSQGLNRIQSQWQNNSNGGTQTTEAYRGEEVPASLTQSQVGMTNVHSSTGIHYPSSLSSHCSENVCVSIKCDMQSNTYLGLKPEAIHFSQPNFTENNCIDSACLDSHCFRRLISDRDRTGIEGASPNFRIRTSLPNHLAEERNTKEILTEMRHTLNNPNTISHHDKLTLNNEYNAQIMSHCESGDQVNTFTENDAQFKASNERWMSHDCPSSIYSPGVKGAYTASSLAASPSYLNSGSVSQKTWFSSQNFMNPSLKYENEIWAGLGVGERLGRESLDLPKPVDMTQQQLTADDTERYRHHHGNSALGYLGDEDNYYRDEVLDTSPPLDAYTAILLSSSKAEQAPHNILREPPQQSDKREHQSVNLELAAKQFNKVMGLADEDIESSWSDTTCPSQPSYPQPSYLSKSQTDEQHSTYSIF